MGSAKASKTERRKRRKRDHGDMEMADAEVHGQTMFFGLCVTFSKHALIDYGWTRFLLLLEGSMVSPMAPCARLIQHGHMVAVRPAL